VRALTNQPLEPWQAVRLHEEFEKGRRTMKVKQVAAELQLQREEVIEWLKDCNEMSESRRQSLKEAAMAAREASKSRTQMLKDGKAAAAEAARKPSFAERQAAGGDFAKKRLRKDAQATLEAVWANTRWPTDDILKDIYKLHRVPKGKVLEWFAEKRASEPHSARERRRDRNDKLYMNKNFNDPK